MLCSRAIMNQWGLWNNLLKDGNNEVHQDKGLVWFTFKLKTNYSNFKETELICLIGRLIASFDFPSTCFVFSVSVLLQWHPCYIIAYKTAASLIRNIFIPSCLQCCYSLCDVCCMLHGFIQHQLHIHGTLKITEWCALVLTYWTAAVCKWMNSNGWVKILNLA